MRTLARILVDEAHRQAWSTRPEVASRMRPGNPADCGMIEAARVVRDAGFEVSVHGVGPLTPEVLAQTDVLVVPHCSTDDWEATTGVGSPVYAAAEIDAIESFVRGGGGLVILAETEQPKYGNSLAELAGRFGIGIVNATVQDPVRRFKDVSTWVLLDPAAAAGDGARSDLFAHVAGACFYRTGVLSIGAEADPAAVFARTHASAAPPRAPVLVGAAAGAGRVVVAADSDFVGDDSIADLDNRTLWLNIVTWAAVRDRPAVAVTGRQGITARPEWAALAGAVEEIRPLQDADGAIAGRHHARATELVAAITAGIVGLAPHLPHQADHLAATIRDFEAWARGGFARPDFLDSLLAFHPERQRRHGLEHLVVFPMVTQNGNPNRNVEAVVTRTVWPKWLADLEATQFANPAFVPVEFAGFTAGYDTHSAVLFPETVGARKTARFTWGAIFCDREAARWRRVSREAAAVLGLTLPPDAEMLLGDQALAQETFAFWDLVHDRTHGRGDLPFDPFMIRQRMPYWMYALEELRCDLTTYRDMAALEQRREPAARHVRLAILFDRLFRFPTTGDRIRNYDGLAGQILFAWLHRRGALRWTDNKLAIDWTAVDPAVVALCSEVEAIYHAGIDRSRLGHWLAVHGFVARLVPPHPASTWARGGAALPGDLRAAIAAALDDEFPLSQFYEPLRRRLAPVIESARGITGVAA